MSVVNNGRRNFAIFCWWAIGTGRHLGFSDTGRQSSNNSSSLMKYTKRLLITGCSAALLSSLLTASGEPASPSIFLQPRFAKVITNSAVKFADVTDYRGKPQELLADIYRPEGDTATNRPSAVLIHGGGFRTSGVRTQKYIVHFANELARRGFVAYSIDYRQRQGSDMPEDADELPALKDATADTLTFLEWLRREGAVYGSDPSAIFLVGGSAGGRIAATIACRENGDNGGLPVEDRFSTVQPPSSVTSDAKADYNRTGLIAATILWGGPEPFFRCFTVDDGDLPSLFIHGTHDSTVPVEGSVHLHDQLAKAGVPSRLHLLNGYAHSLQKTDAAGEDAKPQSAQWMADFFVQEWERQRAGEMPAPAVPELRVAAGAELKLVAPVSGSGFAPKLQWRRDGKDLPGANGPDLAIATAGVDDAGLYEVAVTNPPGGWGRAEVAAITVDRVPVSSISFSPGADHTHPEEIVVPAARVVVE